MYNWEEYDMRRNNNDIADELIYTFTIDKIIGEPENGEYYTELEWEIYYDTVRDIMIEFVEELDNLFKTENNVLLGERYEYSNVARYYRKDDGSLDINYPTSYYEYVEYGSYEILYGQYIFCLYPGDELLDTPGVYMIFEIYNYYDDYGSVEVRFGCYYSVSLSYFYSNLTECFEHSEYVDNPDLSEEELDETIKEADYVADVLYDYFKQSCKSVLKWFVK